MTDSVEEGGEEYKELYLKAQFVTGLFCYPVVCLFGLIGNVLSIVILSRQKMRTSTKTYLIAMALSDGIKLINDSFYFFVILIVTIDRERGERAYVYLYPYAHYFFNMSVCTTAWLTVSVAFERYVLVCHATRSRNICSVHKARITCMTVFLSMSVLTVPLGGRYRTVSGLDDNRTNSSSVRIEVTELWLNEDFVETYTWIQNLLRSVIPLTILCTLNCFIVQALRSSVTFRKTKHIGKTFSSRHRITLTLVAVIVVFMACVMPDAVMSTFFGYGYYDANYFVRALREFTDLLLTLNSALNFLLYCTFNKSFRQSLPLTFHGRCCRIGKRVQRQKEKYEMNSRVMSFATVRRSTNILAADEKSFNRKQRRTSYHHHCHQNSKGSNCFHVARKGSPWQASIKQTS